MVIGVMVLQMYIESQSRSLYFVRQREDDGLERYIQLAPCLAGTDKRSNAIELVDCDASAFDEERVWA